MVCERKLQKQIICVHLEPNTANICYAEETVKTVYTSSHLQNSNKFISLLMSSSMVPTAKGPKVLIGCLQTSFVSKKSDCLSTFQTHEVNLCISCVCF